MEREIVERYISELDSIAEDSFQKGKIGCSLAALNASAKLQYHWNQDYVDKKAEILISRIADEQKSQQEYRARVNMVLFYDGFGLDTRGLALIYVKALCKLGYEVIYVVPTEAKGRQPEIQKQTKEGNIRFVYLTHNTGTQKIVELLGVFNAYQPVHAFFYTVPWDAEACVAFATMEGKCVRYQINLTDHAFWLGKESLDVCVEFREYGACISQHHRHINIEKLQLLPYYPFVDQEVPFVGFDFNVSGKKILFSGGALYKTFGGNGKFYYVVSELLKRHSDLLFLYAGSGDTSGIMKLKNEFKGRCIYIEERKDLYAVMRHITLYFNTYPLLGGLMTQYAAIAQKVPLTLIDSSSVGLDGIILNRNKLHIEFADVEALLKEADHLLFDDTYRIQEERKLQESVYTEVDFQKGVEDLLTVGKTSYSFSTHFIDTSTFQMGYRERFTKNRLERCIINRETGPLWRHYPVFFLHRIYHKLFRRCFCISE